MRRDNPRALRATPVGDVVGRDHVVRATFFHVERRRDQDRSRLELTA
jgi:hypothetical protein